MKNPIIYIFGLLLILAAPGIQACEHTPLQHQVLLDTYLEFPVAHAGIANCQHLNFGYDSETQLILLSLETPQGSDPYTHIVLLITDLDLIAKHQIMSLELDDVALEDNSHLPAFSHYSSSVGWTQYYIYQIGKGFVPSAKMNEGEGKPVRHFAETQLDYLPYNQILINTYVGLDTELEEMLFLLGSPDSIWEEEFDLLDEEAQFFQYGQSTIMIVDERVLEFKLANEGDELAQIVVGSSAADLESRFPYSFGERLTKENGYSITIALLNPQHQIGDYRYLSIYVEDGLVSKISLWVNP